MTRVFRLFISSTFQDWSPEREYLRAYVFPRLQKLCEDKGGRFLPVDLRWGISEEAGNTHDTVGICLEEIERCQRLTPKPNFLVLLGNRYGWRPIPATISKSQWDKLCELKIIQDESLWTKWYQLDENSCEPTYILRAKDDNWEEDERELRKQLDQLVEKYHSFTENELAFLVGSVTEQEIVRGALAIPNASEHVYAFERVFSNDVEHASYTDFSKGSVDEFASKSLQVLKVRLSKYLGDNYHKLPKQDFDTSWIDGERPVAYLEKLGAQVFESLSRVIKQEFESCEAEEFISPDTAYFVGRSDELKVMNQSRSHPLMVFGNPGSGKSTLLSRYVQELTNKGAQVLSFWVGRNPECATGAGFLRIFLREIQTRELVLDEFQWDDYSVAGVIESSELLKRALSNLKPESSNLVVIIDAVDQWGKDDPARDLNWMPYNGQFICSSLDNEQRKYFISQFGDASILPLDVLSREDAKTLLDSWLNRDGRKLQNKQKTLLIDAFDGMPLHLRILYEAAIGWHSYDDTPDRLPNSADAAIKQLYERWASESEHGATMAQRTLAYLTAAPNGLSESELLALLRLDEHVVASFRYRSPQSPSIDALPEIIWSRLFHDLEPFLAERHIHGELLFDFYHMQFRRVAEKWIPPVVLRDCCKRIAALFLRNWGEQGINTTERVLHELAPALKRSDEVDNLFLVARDHSFLKQQDDICFGLSMEPLELALQCSIERKIPQAMVEFCIVRAQRLEVKKKVSPLDLLRGSGSLEQVMILADIFQPEISELWHLLASVYLAQQGELEKASIVLFQLNKKEHAKFTAQSKASKMRSGLIQALIDFKVLPCEALSSKEQVEYHLDRAELSAALEVAKKIRTQNGVQQLLQIAHACVTKSAENLYWQAIELARDYLEILIKDARKASSQHTPWYDYEPELKNLYDDILVTIGSKQWSMETLDYAILKSEEEWAIACYGNEELVDIGELTKEGKYTEAIEHAVSNPRLIVDHRVRGEGLAMIALAQYQHACPEKGKHTFNISLEAANDLDRDYEYVPLLKYIAYSMVRAGEEAWAKDLVSDIPDGQLCIIKGLLELERLEEAKDILSVINGEEIKNKALLMIADKYWELGSSQLADNFISQLLETECCFKNKHVLYDICNRKIKHREFDNPLWKCVGQLTTEFPNFLLNAPLASATKKLDTYPVIEVLHSLIRMKRLNQFPIYFEYLTAEQDRVVILECLKPLVENSVRGVSSCLSKILSLYKSNIFYNVKDAAKALREMLVLADLFEANGKIKVVRSILFSLCGVEVSIRSAIVEKELLERAVVFAEKHYYQTEIVCKMVYLFFQTGLINVAVGMLDGVTTRLKEAVKDDGWTDFSAGKDFVFLVNGYLSLSKKGKVKNVMADALLVESKSDLRASPSTLLPLNEANLISKTDELIAEIRRYLRPPYEEQAVINLLSIADSLANNEQMDLARNLYSRIIKDIKVVEKSADLSANHSELMYKTVTSMASIGLIEIAMETTLLMDGFNYKGKALSDLSVILSDIDCSLQKTYLDDVHLLLEKCKHPNVEAMISYMKALVVFGQVNTLPPIKKRIIDIAAKSSSEGSRSQYLNALAEFLVASGLYKDALDVIEKIPMGAIEPNVLRCFPVKVDEFKSLLQLPLSKSDVYILSGKIASSYPLNSKEIFNFMMA